MKRFAIVFIFSCVLAIMINLILPTTKKASAELNDFSIIIDAGHGLPDGGAVADDGTVESDINLKIAKKLEYKFNLIGIKCIMTRTDENCISTEGNTIHQKKVSDIRNRVSIAKNNPESLLISIHMNTYPDADVSGTQIFYNSNSEFSKELAIGCQDAINTVFQKENNKKAKAIPKTIYLFNNIKNDSILIECGFLTNNEDLTKFNDELFVDRFTDTVTESIMYKMNGCDNNGK